ncbi:MarR family winged helix-turn-helix transcriptional regulator [Paenibacillus tyrfis]|uniref:MarR family transcriptional regulator n=1 Tax=Paenibacillus tyrfis TaxID=1501230 RepID=A0A081NUI9_9BACL|nr:MarR family transcriptional regulator [Paenibacillus tyrfis]KEQ22112.1 MarR family transcriptional regulator [Paenibacillus tyrfis]
MTIYDTSVPKSAELIHLLRHAAHYIQQEFEAELTNLDLPFQLSGTRLRLLLTIWRANAIRMNELAIKLGVKARTITEHIDALERYGLVTRVPDPNDRRATLLQLTKEALTHIDQLKDIPEQVSKILLQKFSDEQRIQFYELLTLLFNGKEFDFDC